MLVTISGDGRREATLLIRPDEDAFAERTSGDSSECDRVDARQERGEVVVRRGAVAGREVCRGVGAATSDSGEIDAVGRRGRGHVRDLIWCPFRVTHSI
jgi:hypothetical protein